MAGVRVNRRVPNPLGWPVYDVEPVGATLNQASRTSVVIYVHGGGWVNEIRIQH